MYKRQGDDSAIDDVPELDQNDRLWKLIIMIVLGIICVVVGSQVTVDAASSIAKEFGVSDRIIGLTIVSIGTSLPELVTSVNASLKGRNDMAIGNIIGSNIFNILFVLGTAALVAPRGIPFASGFMLDGVIAIDVYKRQHYLHYNKATKEEKLKLTLEYINYEIEE